MGGGERERLKRGDVGQWGTFGLIGRCGRGERGCGGSVAMAGC